MELDKLNKWLTLIANLGVLIGVFFLVVELRQSNSIANREAASEITSAGSKLNSGVVENPEFAMLRSKLRDADAELSPMEEEQALSWTLMQLNFYILVDNSYENGLIDESLYEIYQQASLRTVRRYPGMFNFLIEVLSELKLTSRSNSIIDRLLEER